MSMTIGQICGAHAVPMTQPGANQTEDAVSKNLRKQIENAQKKLQDLSADTELSMEEKMKRRQEIQQEIASLNQELRQHQMDVKREQQQEKIKQAAENAGQRKTQKGSAEEQSAGLSGRSQQAMIGADAALKQAKTCDSVEISMEGRARVLASEIQTDKSRGADTVRKETELSDVKERMQKAQENQVSVLTDASQELSGARKEDAAEEASAVRPEDAAQEKEAIREKEAEEEQALADRQREEENH